MTDETDSPGRETDQPARDSGQTPSGSAQTGHPAMLPPAQVGWRGWLLVGLAVFTLPVLKSPDTLAH